MFFEEYMITSAVYNHFSHIHGFYEHAELYKFWSGGHIMSASKIQIFLKKNFVEVLCF